MLWLIAIAITIGSVINGGKTSESLFPWPIWIGMCIASIPFVISVTRTSFGDSRPKIEPKLWGESWWSTLLTAIAIGGLFLHIWGWYDHHKEVMSDTFDRFIILAAFFLTITSIGGISRTVFVLRELAAKRQ